MKSQSDQAPVAKNSADHLPRSVAYAIWATVGLCLLVTVALAFAAYDADRRAAKGAFAVKAERFFSTLSHAVETRLDVLHHVALLAEVSPPQASRDDRTGRRPDAFRSLYWHAADLTAIPAAVARLNPGIAIPPQHLDAFRNAMAASRPGVPGFAASPNGADLLIAVHLPASDQSAPSGFLLASMGMTDLVEHARVLAGLEDEVLAVTLPGQEAPSPLHDSGNFSVARSLNLQGTTWLASVSSRGPPPRWWRGVMLANVLTAGTAITLAAMMAFNHVVRHAREVSRSRQDQATRAAEVSTSLKRIEADTRMAWRMLKEEKFIDGYALWDENDRLVEYSGFLDRYLPDLASWGQPTAREVVEALVNGGHVVLLQGVEPSEVIARMCMVRREVPGLREVEMVDGQIFMARTIDLAEGRRACVFTNVTELRSRERESRDAAALFRTAFDSSPLMMALLDQDERPIAVNRSLGSVLGHSYDRFRDLGWQGIVHPDDNAGVGGGTPSWEPVVKRILAADGSIIRGRVRFTPVSDDQGNREGRRLLTIEDLTSRWEAEERACYQASLLDQVTNAVLSVDRSGRIVYGNRATQTLFKWTGQMLRGIPVDRLLGAEVTAALTEPKAEIETEGVTWSGSRFPAQVTITRLSDEAGQSVGSVLVVSDLTQRRAVDMQLMHSARLATLGEMSASIAHEFNQCLHVIRLSSEALRMDLADGVMDLARVAKRSDNILSQVDRLTEMVGQMRSISRRDGTAKRTFQPQAVVESAIRMVEPLMVADGVTLVRVGSLDQAGVLGHPVRLEQVLINLLNNARDAIHDRAALGGPTTGTVTVTCDAETTPGWLAIRIGDDGTGVPDDVAATIFEPFVTTKDDMRGCGLGLSISRGIVQAMGGALTFRNLDRGAEFSVELPVAEPITQMPPPEAPLPEEHPVHDDDGAVDGHRILLVDDEALSVMMVAEFLERHGYVVDTAYDGLEALAKAEAQVYGTVITDIRMPRMGGIELIRRLEDLQPGTPVIVVTGHLKEGTQAELGPNVVAVLTKPFHLLELRQQVARAEAGFATVQQGG